MGHSRKLAFRLPSLVSGPKAARGFLYTLFVCLLVGLLTTCRSRADWEGKFVEKYYAEDFSAFDNQIIFTRGGNNKGNLLVIYISRQLEALCRDSSSGVLVQVDFVSRRVKRILPPLPAVACLAAVDTVAIKRVVGRFLQYKVQSIRADGSGNVAIGFRSGDGGSVDLVRVAVADSMDSSFQEEFTLLRGPWYSRKQ